MEDSEKEKLVMKASGFKLIEAPKGANAPKYAITGNGKCIRFPLSRDRCSRHFTNSLFPYIESQVVTVALGAGDTVKGEPGVMMYLTAGVTQTATCDGCCVRCLSGESCFVMNFNNSGSNGEIGYAAMTPNDPLAKVIPVDMAAPEVGGTLIAQQGAFMASYGDVHISISLDCNFCRCCCGGVGLVRQKIEGNGIVFLGGTGTIVQKVLAPGEVMIIDTNCILAFAESCTLDIKRAGGVLGMLGGGEGIFNTTLTGPGLVVVQSMNKQMFLDALAANKIYRR